MDLDDSDSGSGNRVAHDERLRLFFHCRKASFDEYAREALHKFDYMIDTACSLR